jgi:hypothetical protein
LRVVGAVASIALEDVLEVLHVLAGGGDVPVFVGAVVDGHLAEARVLVLAKDLTGANGAVTMEPERLEGIDAEFDGTAEGVALEPVDAALDEFVGVGA